MVSLSSRLSSSLSTMASAGCRQHTSASGRRCVHSLRALSSASSTLPRRRPSNSVLALAPAPPQARAIHTFFTCNTLRDGSSLSFASALRPSASSSLTRSPPSGLEKTILHVGVASGISMESPSLLPSCLSLASPLGATRTRIKKAAKPPKKYKLKTKSCIKKRFRLTASGRFKRRQAGKSHLNINKSRNRLRRLRKLVHTKNTQTKLLKRMYFK